MPRIFTIIVTYNGSKTISKCFESLKKSDLDVQLIVIDNASTDNTRAMIQKISDITYYPLEKNIGFGQANNIGIDYAIEQNADFVFLLNQDAMVKKDTISKLVDAATENPKFGILSPIHLNRTGLKIDSKVLNYIYRGNKNFINDAFFNRIQHIYELPFINAAAWLISSRCIKAVGKFSPIFFMYGEDNDYCHRAKKEGFKIGLVPGSIVYHERIIDLPDETGWDDIKRTANRNAIEITVQLIKTKEHFFKEILFWIIDQNSKLLKGLINRTWEELSISILTGFIVLKKIPEIISHRKEIQQNSIKDNL